jgi:4-hydroxythreonine-4-phosphate dehydrogenase
MNTKPILIITGEPYSVFSEILFKALKNNKFHKKIVLIGSHKLLKKQCKYLKIKANFNLIKANFDNKSLKKSSINLININESFAKPFDKITTKSKLYNKKCFNLALYLMKKKKFSGLINGPISKKHFLQKKFFGVTEYLSNKTNSKKFGMLIYSKNLSVSPITTHIPLKKVSKSISKQKIINQVKLIKNFYRKNFKTDPRIAITGLNPHCESNLLANEESLIIKPAITILKKIYKNVSGPYPADSLFMKNNLKKYDVIVGMYHDQVLTPLKSLYNFEAINITLGLPFIRISPDHGTNYQMAGKNISNPESLIKSIKFIDNT